MIKKSIPFSPPDISDNEINGVIDVLKSGWITTGPKTKFFEKSISDYCNTKKTVCLNSATACLELTLRLFGIGEGDEVITSAYTYTASASVITHIGAKVVLVDTSKDSFFMDYQKLEKAITPRTKAIIPIDIAGVMCDYDKIIDISKRNRDIFKPSNSLQKALGRVLVLSDGAHSFGSSYNNVMSGSMADFTCFSFHAVKNLTTAEGGAVTWRDMDGIDNDWIYRQYMLMSLHGQSKDALSKTQIGGWEYDIVKPYYKCNMTDIMSAIGLAQLERYNGLLSRRKQIIDMYDKFFENTAIITLNHNGESYKSNGHLYLTRVKGANEKDRNNIIKFLAEEGISCNVHYKPLPLLTAYKDLGFEIKDYPNAFYQYQNEITLPLHTKLTDSDVEYIASNYIKIVGSYNG